MRLHISILMLLAAITVGCQADSSVTTLDDLPLRRAMLRSECPIQYCNTGRNCIYSSRTKKWRCTSCTGLRIPNGAKSECVCPAGYFPTSDGGCSLCKDNMFCPQGQSALRSPARPCPANTVTLRRGAKSINDCFNSPGYFYRKTLDGVRAVPCGVNRRTTGLKKQTTCTACPTGFKTDPETVPGSHTSSDVCQAPAGSFVTGASTTLCPKGEYSDDYSLATACKTCEDLYDGPGITTAREGSTSAKNCTWLEPGYALMDDKKRAILGQVDLIITPISGAKKCPQNWYCPGGDPNGAGMPTKCEHNMWTEDEGASSPDECVAPPGMYLPDGDLTAEDKKIKHCPHGTYKETWQRVGVAGCLPCGTGYWLSDKTIFLSELDPNSGMVRQQIGVRGSTDSCFIQRGMGAVFERNQTTGATVLRAVICPADHYGVVGVGVKGAGGIEVFKKYGRVATPCTQCPTNMITSGDTDNLKVANIQVINPTNDQQTKDFNALSTEGYYTVDSCFTKPGYGYLQGASQLCAEGFWSAGGHRLPCTQCPFGRTTKAAVEINSDAANCTKYIAGYGELNSIPQLCAIGQYQPPQVDVGTPCQACPASLTTRAVGGASLAACDLCAAGWGTIALNSTCKSCQDGYYGDSNRKDSACTKCPSGRSFSYDWQGVDDIFTPQTTSKPYSSSQADCVADFAQTVDGAFYLDLQYALGASSELLLVPGRENLQSCVQECREEAKCAAATFDYESLKCWNWEPASKESFVANGGVAFKLLSSTNLAASTDKVAAQEMGSGEYSFIPDGDNTPARIATSSRDTPVATTSLRACLKACSNVNLCSGVVFGQLSGEDTIAADSCKLIMGKSMPGNSLRTLIQANFMGLNTNTRVSAGYFSQPGSNTVAVCPASSSADAVVANRQGWFCLGGDVGSAPRTRCAAANPTGTYMPEGAEKADDCGAWLLPGYYYKQGNTPPVVPCEANSFCPGGDNIAGATANKGIQDCPTGTQNTGGITAVSMANCNKLVLGYYYLAPGPISSDTVKQCDPGFYCDTEGVAIDVNTTTGAGAGASTGRNECPAGVLSAVFAKAITDCTRLQAGYQYESGAATGGADISDATIKTCDNDRFCAGERAITNGAELLGTPCPEGTGVAKKTDDTVAGAKSANECTKLYEGYYYTGIGMDISRSTVKPCPANQFCLGYPNNPSKATITRGTPILPTGCPTGTKRDAGTTTPSATADEDWRTANLALLPGRSAADGARSTNDCDRLVAGYYYDGTNVEPFITNSTIKVCEPGKFCSTEGILIEKGDDTNSGASGYTDPGVNNCVTGVTSLAGAKSINDCNIVLARYYYDGSGPISNSNIKDCPQKSYCPGGMTVVVGSETGRFACAAGTTTFKWHPIPELLDLSASSSADCSLLLPGYYYTGAGDISDDTVLQCPDDSYCIGVARPANTDSSCPGCIVVGTPLGKANCPTGSGTAAVAWTATNRDSINDCINIKPGYYYLGSSGCSAILADTSAASCTFKVCDFEGTDAYCNGATDVGLLTVSAGRTTCATDYPPPSTLTSCDVAAGREGVDCISTAQCISP